MNAPSNRFVRIKEPSREPIRVSDHAVLRYLERAMGLNVDLVRQHIQEICLARVAFGAACVRTEGLRFEIVESTVVTVKHDHPGATSSYHRAARNGVR